jgi:hypothetical protein
MWNLSSIVSGIALIPNLFGLKSVLTMSFSPPPAPLPGSATALNHLTPLCSLLPSGGLGEIET